ncbi:hypothetical protein LSTR_LSTR004434 [Laodelphax striatellus]|uniref:Translocon-associated protein subunit delta n=1 Tax=Laodelphax striatellus TaxID=195883 RepID=A0A482WZB9_LAOST|nr:hypothetical protein LSTR_LSTR017494 [Laodelphax striatellus]RZF42515.1 hypothetical protein LSTR_LSTR004434 [Laodelphax striatellus]
MGYLVFVTSILAFCASTVLSSSCTKPEVSAISYTTQDATVLTKIAFVAEFSLKCENKAKNIPLYAEVNGKTLPAVQKFSGPTVDNEYQVSWVEEVKKSRSGDYKVNLYDEEGYGLLRKAIRNGEDISTVKPLVTIILSHPGAYQGPWVNSEFMALVLSILVWYLAFTAKSKVLS